MVDPVTLRPYKMAIALPYADYCCNVSQWGMAVSMETAAWFAFVCCTRQATHVLDLGSGFTSYVARCVADKVVSVDDSPAWLEATGGFLKEYNLPSDGLMLWDDWKADRGGPFDVVIHDFSSGDARERAMWDAADVLAPGGVLIFDDAHHAGHHAEMMRVIDAFGFRLVESYRETVDPGGRWALTAVNE